MMYVKNLDKLVTKQGMELLVRDNSVSPGQDSRFPIIHKVGNIDI